MGQNHRHAATTPPPSRPARGSGWRGYGNTLILRCAFSILLLCSGTSPAAAVEAQISEYQVKAAYLYNFAKFIAWPAENGQDNFVICVLGKNPFGNALDQMTGKQVHNRPLAIRYISSVADIKSCNLLFISSSEQKNLHDILASLKSQRGVMTVSDNKRFVESGGMIGLVIINDRVCFEINNRAAQQAGMQISSHLLKLATNLTE